MKRVITRGNPNINPKRIQSERTGPRRIPIQVGKGSMLTPSGRKPVGKLRGARVLSNREIIRGLPKTTPQGNARGRGTTTTRVAKITNKPYRKVTYKHQLPGFFERIFRRGNKTLKRIKR